MNRLKTRYQQEVVPALKKEFGYTNVMAIPKVEKVVVNMGLGEAISNGKILDDGERAPLAVKTGDQILFGKYSGSEIKVSGEEYLIVREDEILAVFEK